MAGGGVGEAALLGAVIGGGSSALSGRDPLEGALLGGLTGGAGAGIFGGAGAATAGEAMGSLAGTAGYDAALAAGTPLSEIAGLSSMANTAGGLGALGYTTPQALQLANAGYTAPMLASAPVEAASLVGAPAAAPSGGLFDALKNVGTSFGDGQSGTTMDALKQVGSSALQNVKEHPVQYGLAAAVPLVLGNKGYDPKEPDKYEGPLSKFKYDPDRFTPYEAPRPNPYYRAQYNSYGLRGFAPGGRVDNLKLNPALMVQKSVQDPLAAVAAGNQALEGASSGQPTTNATHATPAQNQALNDTLSALSNMGIMGIVSNIADSMGVTGPTGPAPISESAAAVAAANGGAQGDETVVGGPGSGDPDGNTDGGAESSPWARGGAIRGGIASLGGYSDGGRMLKGPGDGMSDSIPASIENKRPARLATDEFVIPADVVSHLGNGSSDAGAKQLYAMMDRVRKARTGNKKQGKQINPQRFMPA